MADIVILNSRIWTGDSQNPFAQALASTGGTITKVGSSDEVEKLITSKTKVIVAQKLNPSHW